MFGIHRMSPTAVAAGLAVLVVLAGGARAQADQEPATTDPHASHGTQEGHDAQGAHAGHDDQAEQTAPAEPTAPEDHSGHAGHAEPSAHSGYETEAPAPAAEVPAPGQPASTLRPDALDAPVATSVTDAQRSVKMSAEMAAGGHAGHGEQGGHGGHGGHGAHGVARYRHTDVGRGPAAFDERDVPPAPAAGTQQEQHQHHTPEQHQPEQHQHQHPEQHQHGEPDAAPATGNYICPMHSEVVSETPGTCPRCGMALVPRKGEE